MAFDGTDVNAGILGTVAARYEDTYATRATGNTGYPIGVIKTATFRRIDDYITQGGIRDSREAYGFYNHRYHYEALTEGQIQDILPFFMALGKISTTGASAPYTHDIDILRGDTGGTAEYLPSWTLEGRYHSDSDTDITLLGCTVNDWTFTFPVDDAATFSLNWIAKEKGAQLANVSGATDDVFAPPIVDILIDDDAATYNGGTSVKGVNNLTISGSNSLDIHYDHGAKTIRQPYMGNVKDTLTGSLDRKYIDTDLTALVDGSVFSMKIEMDRNATSDYIDVFIDGCYITNAAILNMTDGSAIDNTPIDFTFTSIRVDGKNSNAEYETVT